MNWLSKQLHKELWSPYVAGVLLGIVVTLAVLAGHLVGGSGAFETIAGTIGKAVAPKIFDVTYFNYIMPPGLTWGVVLLVGIAAGGFIGAATSGTLMWGKKSSTISDPQWVRVFGPQVWKRWVLGFIGAIILEYGAGIAGGCTSGLAIAGGSLLVPAAFLFIGGMFASGILVALVVYRNRF